MYFLFQQDVGSRHNAGQGSYKGMKVMKSEKKGVGFFKGSNHTHIFSHAPLVLFAVVNKLLHTMEGN